VNENVTPGPSFGVAGKRPPQTPGSDEDDGHLLPTLLQFLLKLRSSHPQHPNFENQAFSRIAAIGREKVFRRLERSDGKT
jgi:hypothetical protein